MIGENQVRNLIGATAYDPSGDRIGKIGQVYYDDESNQPTWATVNTGLFGTHETFVPVQDAELSGDRVTLGHAKAKIKDAPNIAEDGHLSPDEEQQLYRYYGLGYGTSGTDTHADTTRRDVRDRDGDGGRIVGHDTSGPTTDEAMTRSEEQLRVGTEAREVGRARLRKHVVTEQQQATVAVSHEEVTLEREPITDANRAAAYDGPTITEAEHEITLNAERAVVDTEAVAVERVKLGKQTVTEKETVRGEVRKEEIELDKGHDTDRGDRRR